MADLPNDVQTGKIAGYNEEKGFGFINWPDHTDIHFSRFKNRELLQGKKRPDIIDREVKFYAREGKDADHPTAEIVEILGITAQPKISVSSDKALKVSLSGEPTFLTIVVEFNINGTPQAGREISFFLGRDRVIKERVQPSDGKKVVPIVTAADGIAFGYLNLGEDFSSEESPTLIVKADGHEAFASLVPPAPANVAKPKDNDKATAKVVPMEVVVGRQRPDGSQIVSFITRDTKGKDSSGTVIIDPGQDYEVDRAPFGPGNLKQVATNAEGRSSVAVTLLQESGPVAFRLTERDFTVTKPLLKRRDNKSDAKSDN